MTQSNGLFRKILLYLACISLLIGSITGCQKATQKTYESISPQKETISLTEEQTAFEDFTLDLFRDEITENTLNLHYTLADPSSYDISDYPLTFGEFSQKSIEEACEQAKALRKELRDFHYDDLTATQQITYDVLDNTLKLNTEVSAFPYYEEALQPLIGLQTELPTLLAEYTFRTEQDITDYLALLGDMDRYFDQIILYEQEKAAAGLFMSDYCADMVIKDCQSFLSDKENHFLITTFEERLDAMGSEDSAQKASYQKQNEAVLADQVFPAYQKLIDALTNLKGSGTNEGGLCNFKSGSDYYLYLLKQSVGTDRSVEELENMTLEQINSDLQTLQTILQEKPQLETQLNEFSFSQTDPETILNDLQSKILDDFPALTTKIQLHVKYVSESMEDSLSPAFYLTPPIDNLTDNVIYINKKLCTVSDLYTTLAHEGYPGHLYQTVYSSACCDSPIRQICSVAGYSEGWATYVENLAYQYDTELDSDLTTAARCNNSANLGIYALLDFYIHYDGWTYEEVREWIQEIYTINDEDTIKELYYSIVSQPCNYLKYYIGYLEILDLKTDAQEALGENFNLKQFHTFLLEIGDAPFYLIREYMHSWIQSLQG